MGRIAKIYFANTDSQGLAKLCRFHASQALAESNKAFYTEIANVLEQQQADLKALKEQLADCDDIIKSLIAAGEWINDMTYESFDQGLIHRAKLLIEKIEG